MLVLKYWTSLVWRCTLDGFLGGEGHMFPDTFVVQCLLQLLYIKCVCHFFFQILFKPGIVDVDLPLILMGTWWQNGCRRDSEQPETAHSSSFSDMYLVREWAEM